MRQFIRKILQYKGESQAGLSILLVNDRRIQKLNIRYLNRPSPTDVLAFSSREGEGLALENWLGDIVISTEAAIRQAERLKKDPDKEMHLYLAHGLLHLLGYNDRTRKGREEMRRKEMQVVRKFYTCLPQSGVTSGN